MFGQSFTPAGVAALVGPLGGRGERDPRRSRSPSRSSDFNDDRLLGRARPVPLPAGAAAHDRLRDAVAHAIARSAISPPRATCRRRGARRRPSSPRCWRPTSSMPPRPTPRPPTRRGSAPSACETLAEAGRRALSLALGREAQRAFDRAAELDRGRRTASRAARPGRARGAVSMRTTGSARERLEAGGRAVRGAGRSRCGVRARSPRWRGRSAVEDRLDEAVGAHAAARSTGLPEGGAEQAAALAGLSTHLGVSAATSRRPWPRRRRRSAIAEPLEQWRTVVGAFNTIAHGARAQQGRIEEAIALRERALKLALAHELDESRRRCAAYNNLADVPLQADHFAEALATRRARARTGQARVATGAGSSS